MNYLEVIKCGDEAAGMKVRVERHSGLLQVFIGEGSESASSDVYDVWTCRKLDSKDVNCVTGRV